MLNLFDHIFKRESFKIKMIKVSQNNKYYQKSETQAKEAGDKSGLLAEIKILLLLAGHNFLQN